MKIYFFIIFLKLYKFSYSYIEINEEYKIIPSFPFGIKKDDIELYDLTVQGEFGLGIKGNKGSDLVNIYIKIIINEKILGLELNEKDDLINLNLEANKKEFTYCDLSSKKFMIKMIFIMKVDMRIKSYNIRLNKMIYYGAKLMK